MVCAKERVRTDRRINFHALRTVFDAAHKGASEVRTVCGSAASTGLCGGWLATAIPTATSLFVGFGISCAGEQLAGSCQRLDFAGARFYSVSGADPRVTVTFIVRLPRKIVSTIISPARF